MFHYLNLANYERICKKKSWSLGTNMADYTIFSWETKGKSSITANKECETELADVPVLLYTCICALCILWLILKFYHFQPWRTKLICCIICFNFVNPYGIHGKWQKRLCFFNPDGLTYYWIGLIAGCSFLDVFLCFFAFLLFIPYHTPKLSSHWLVLLFFLLSPLIVTQRVYVVGF